MKTRNWLYSLLGMLCLSFLFLSCEKNNDLELNVDNSLLEGRSFGQERMKSNSSATIMEKKVYTFGKNNVLELRITRSTIYSGGSTSDEERYTTGTYQYGHPTLILKLYDGDIENSGTQTSTSRVFFYTVSSLTDSELVLKYSPDGSVERIVTETYKRM